MKRVDAWVRIIAIPPGEAPDWVRERWVGLVLPLRLAQPMRAGAWGVLTGPRTVLQQLMGALGGRAARHRGWVVDSRRAIELLEIDHPDAADWWRSHAPHMLRPGRLFLFAEHAGVRLPDRDL